MTTLLYFMFGFWTGYIVHVLRTRRFTRWVVRELDELQAEFSDLADEELNSLLKGKDSALRLKRYFEELSEGLADSKKE